MRQENLSFRAERGTGLFQLLSKLLSFRAEHCDWLHQSQCAVEEPAFACSARRSGGEI